MSNEKTYTISGTNVATGKAENAWQGESRLYVSDGADPLALANFKVIQGPPPSYNNYCDIDRLLQTMRHAVATLRLHKVPEAFGVKNYPLRVRVTQSVPEFCIALAAKHGNCCGAAYGQAGVHTTHWAMRGDPLAVFGGVVMLNFVVDIEIAAKLLDLTNNKDKKEVSGKARLLSAVVAASFDKDAKRTFKRFMPRCTLLANKALQKWQVMDVDRAPRFRYVSGGFLVQPNYTFVLDLHDPQVERVGIGPLGNKRLADLAFAWAIGSTSNSNTITIVHEQKLVGNGVGQQDRVGAAELAVARMRRHWPPHETKYTAVAYSDSFFPFPDGPQTLIDAGVKIILASSGSVKDKVVKETCIRQGATLYLIPDSMGRGFYHH